MDHNSDPLQELYPRRLAEIDTDLGPPANTIQAQHFIRHGANDFHPDDQILLNVTPESRPSSTQESSIVPDGGISLSSDVTNTKRQERLFEASEVAAIGLQNQNRATFKPLGVRIRDKLVVTAGGNNKFLPVDQLNQLISVDNTTAELARCGVQGDLATTVRAVLKTMPRRRGNYVSRQRIFAILCLLEKASEIRRFIEEDIFDDDLPFVFGAFAQREVYRELSAGVRVPIELFRNSLCWEIYQIEYFHDHQGKLLAPYFKLSINENRRVHHFPLKDAVVLPFVQDIFSTRAEGAMSLTMHREGGFSVVRKVRIHPSHHNAGMHDLSNDGIFFAVKELKVKEVVTTAPEEALNNEVLTLKRFNDKRHDHLIRLFATYTYQGRINMIFPWADGNLEDFWKTPKAQTSQRSTASETVWMSQQIWGLCRALQSIHVCEMDSDDESRNLPEAAYQKIYGRHGDLKPENILWFRSIQNSQGEQSFDVLQIADFGFADFHGPDSKSNVRLSRIPGFTDSYKAPEFEGNKHVSPSYDIWSLGCILSQFAFWWMRGWDGVDDFSEERATEAPDPITKIPTDIFYKVQHGKISLKKTVALAFERIKQDSDCSDYVLDLIEVIEWQLLRVQPKSRASIDIIVEEFEQMHDRCCEEEAYCTKRTKTPRPSPARINDTLGVTNDSLKVLKKSSISVEAEKNPRRYTDRSQNSSPFQHSMNGTSKIDDNAPSPDAIPGQTDQIHGMLPTTSSVTIPYVQSVSHLSDFISSAGDRERAMDSPRQDNDSGNVTNAMNRPAAQSIVTEPNSGNDLHADCQMHQHEHQEPGTPCLMGRPWNFEAEQELEHQIAVSVGNDRNADNAVLDLPSQKPGENSAAVYPVHMGPTTAPARQSRRRRFKTFVNHVLECCLPENDARPPGARTSQRWSRLFT